MLEVMVFKIPLSLKILNYHPILCVHDVCMFPHLILLLPPAVPNAVSSLSVVPIISNGTAGLYVKWQKTYSDLNITSYEVTISSGEYGGNLNTTNLYQTVEKLKLSTMYTVSVGAISVIGKSVVSVENISTFSGEYFCMV